MNAAPAPERRFRLRPGADEIAGRLLIDVDDFPDTDVVTLVLSLWVRGILAGPAFPDVRVSTDYELIASVELHDGATVHSGTHDFFNLTGIPSEERTGSTVLEAVRRLIGALNVALDAHDAYVAARMEEVEFLRIAIGFNDPSLVKDAVIHLEPTPVTINAPLLLALLDAVDDARPDVDVEEYGEFMSSIAVDTDAPVPSVPELAQLVGELDGDEPDERGYAALLAFASAVGVTTALLDDFEDDADASPSMALETVGFLVSTVASVGMSNSPALAVVFDSAGTGRTFRVAATVAASGAQTALLSAPLPTTLLTGPVGPTTPWRLVHAVQTAVAGLNGAVEAHCDTLAEILVTEEADASPA